MINKAEGIPVLSNDGGLTTFATDLVSSGLCHKVVPLQEVTFTNAN